jgi:hypothetical protein
MKILVQHAKYDRNTGSVLGYTDVAEVNVTEEISAFGTTMECLEYAYRWTNNVLGSWSIKKTSFPDPANGDRINGDYNEDVTVLAPRADGMGLRSTSMFDRMIADGKTYKVDMMGFKEVVLENA